MYNLTPCNDKEHVCSVFMNANKVAWVKHDINHIDVQSYRLSRKMPKQPRFYERKKPTVAIVSINR